MVNKFRFFSPAEIHFGIGTFTILPEIISRFGKSVLVLSGKSISKFIENQSFFKELESKNIRFYVEQISGEPSPQLIDNIVEKYKNAIPDSVVAIGGGSVLDTGKAVSAMFLNDDSIENYLEDIGNKQYNGKKIPFIAVPATSGTGSEATKNAVISKSGKNGFKKSLRHDKLIPDVSVIDPQLTVSCSPELTASTGMDAFSQLLESFVSTSSNSLTDDLAFSGLKKISESLECVYYDGNNIEKRSDIAYASLLGGICLANAGLGTVHGFAASIGGMFQIPHGIVCGSLMAACNKFTIHELLKNNSDKRSISKFARVGQLFVDNQLYTDEYYCNALIDKLYSLTQQFSIPKLGNYGVTHSDIPEIVHKTSNKNNPVQLSEYQLIKILEERI